MKQYSTYQIVNENRQSVFKFFPKSYLPSKYPITTPFTFPFIGEDVVLCLDKNNQWNPLGGHMEDGEDYIDTIIRESKEEVGVIVSKPTIEVVGYILNKNLKNPELSEYPAQGILPITTSFVKNTILNWIPMETKRRGIFRRHRALELMRQRDDNQQMFEILEYVYKKFDKHDYQTSFTYFPNKISSDLPVTQVFTFCKDERGLFCAVRDSDEAFFSLPGGSCELGETPVDCVHRELDEEAQLKCENISLLGSILVELTDNGKTVSRFQHLRYLADVSAQNEFVPGKNGFETVERKFINLSDLKSQVMILQNLNGERIISQLTGLL